jgi:hypothetical protein
MFSGNMGEINNPEPGSAHAPIVTGNWSTNSWGAAGGSWALSFDFGGYPADAFCGGFLSIFGLTDTLVELTGSRVEPSTTTAFSNYFVDFNDVYGDFAPWSGRTIETVAFDTRLEQGSASITLKVELKDENGWDVFARRTNSTTAWTDVTVLRSAFDRSTRGVIGPFSRDRVSTMSILVERNHDADDIRNPTSGAFRVANIRVLDEDGIYPDLGPAGDPATGALRPEYRDAFLDHDFS